MKQVALFFLLIAAASAAAPRDSKDLRTLGIARSAYDYYPPGSYNWGFETDDSYIRHDQDGSFKKIKNEEGKDEDVLVMKGSYSYVDPEGKLITVNYIADETGFHPVGDHIPNVPGVGVPETRPNQRGR